ncbi:hypothetical protein BH10PSE18_BH10PSE18_02250 [soil metagenome]
MHVTRWDQAPAYEAPNHFDMRCLRLQGRNAGPSTQMWMGVSQVLPGGHTTLDPSPMEKIYLVLEGQLTIVSEFEGRRDEQLLGKWDSCRFAPGEKRQLINSTSRQAIVALVMANAPPVAI